jgi:hypothetical protein
VDYFGSARSADEAAFSLSNIYAEIEDVIKLVIDEGQASGEIDETLDPGVTAELLVSVFEGVVLHGVFAKRRRKAESLRPTALRLITAGIFADPPLDGLAAKREDESVKGTR